MFRIHVTKVKIDYVSRYLLSIIYVIVRGE